MRQCLPAWLPASRRPAAVGGRQGLGWSSTLFSAVRRRPPADHRLLGWHSQVAAGRSNLLILARRRARKRPSEDTARIAEIAAALADADLDRTAVQAPNAHSGQPHRRLPQPRRNLSGAGSRPVLPIPVGSLKTALPAEDYNKRLIFIGDVHGCIDELQDLLKECDYSPATDRVIFVGDLVAKGPDSQAVLQLAREIDALSVRGNHDEATLRVRHAWMNPGSGLDISAKHKKIATTLKEEDWEYLSSLPYYLTIGSTISRNGVNPEANFNGLGPCVVVHAGLAPGLPLRWQRPIDMMYMRVITQDGTPSPRGHDGVPWAGEWRGPELVLFGHDAARGLQLWPHAVGLDTGAVYGGKLTAYLLPEKRIVSVPSRRMYLPP